MLTGTAYSTQAYHVHFTCILYLWSHNIVCLFKVIANILMVTHPKFIYHIDNIRKWMMSLLRIGVIEHFMSQWCRWRQLFFSNCLMGIITSLLIKKPIHIWISRIWLHQNSVGKNPLQSKKLGSTAPNIFTFKYPLFFSLGLDRKFGLKQRKRKLRSVDSSPYPKKHTSWSER